MKKQIIKLTENDLHKIIKESVNRILMENGFDDFIEKELKMPYEERMSHMTDEEILGMLKKHKQEQMDYDTAQMRERESKLDYDGDMPQENPNLRDDRGKFSNSSCYVRGTRTLPIK